MLNRTRLGGDVGRRRRNRVLTQHDSAGTDKETRRGKRNILRNQRGPHLRRALDAFVACFYGV